MENVQDTIQKVLVLGNTGSPSVLPLLEFYIIDSSSSKEIRVCGISALRLIDSEEVSLLIKGIKHNNDKLLLNTINEVIEFRNNLKKSIVN
jgi:hypothetical protein